ncbi:MAG: hydrogenase [Phascolarctobacterium sp.]|nr:hydrogenase [Phascolarctobacterium sp.]
MEYLVVALMIIVFLQTRFMELRRSTLCLALQSALIAATCLVVGIAHGGGLHGFLPGILTIVVKVICIPYAILRVVKDLKDEREIVSDINVNYSTAVAAASLGMSYMVIDRIMPNIAGRDILATSMFIIMTGLALIVMRSRAIMQMIGMITMENGIYLLGLIMTEGLPIIIELGIFLDVLIAVVILVILTSRLRLNFNTTDTNVLDKLKG